jgi:hypothetical protein
MLPSVYVLLSITLSRNKIAVAVASRTVSFYFCARAASRGTKNLAPSLIGSLDIREHHIDSSSKTAFSKILIDEDKAFDAYLMQNETLTNSVTGWVKLLLHKIPKSIAN